MAGIDRCSAAPSCDSTSGAHSGTGLVAHVASPAASLCNLQVEVLSASLNLFSRASTSSSENVSSSEQLSAFSLDGLRRTMAQISSSQGQQRPN
ncbi:hypothetical protein Nepgr_011622 [Nepenthes gracilis]|uniref:Uncharacterized protein n=1 Tax=Nepenthes gracilis TaxID=150966 RepID=A0AAD3XMJ4_NEPGR|nr:hypothetical protein Nepgr_011622 [Nepenthes gracilis]